MIDIIFPIELIIFSFGNSLARIHNHMTKALHLDVKYQKIPFEDPNTWPNLGHSNLLTLDERKEILFQT